MILLDTKPIKLSILQILNILLRKKSKNIQIKKTSNDIIKQCKNIGICISLHTIFFHI